MMNRSIGKKANDYFLEIIEWIPRLIHLQLLWFLCVLPVFTLGTASRTVLYMIYHYKKNEEKKLGSLFWKKFRENFSLYGKQASLASVYFLLLLIDYQIFRYWGGGIGYTLMYTTLFLLLLSALLFSYKILLQLEQKEASWITAFFLFFNDFKSALFYLAGTLILLVAFWFAGPIYFALLGFSFLFYFQVLLFIHRTQEKVLKKEE
ncbi:YesL family protein [Enterococcus faecium]|uniref:YesL family protein n=1 Tax=Enterococcus faecium TaxID=1352 RepID=UPI0027399887|nr:YesL family protein [Enterococcus faecium]